MIDKDNDVREKWIYINIAKENKMNYCKRHMKEKNLKYYKTKNIFFCLEYFFVYIHMDINFFIIYVCNNNYKNR